MYKVIKTGFVILKSNLHSTNKKARIPYESKNWLIWRATVTLTTCEYCASMNGHILARNDPRIDGIPIHTNCRCFYGTDGAAYVDIVKKQIRTAFSASEFDNKTKAIMEVLKQYGY